MTSKKDAWQREPGAHEIEVKGRKYRNLVRFTRPCVTCKEPFGIYVSQAVAEGTKSNNNFALKNCEKHRARGVNTEELEQLRSWKATVAEELTYLDETRREVVALQQQNIDLNAQLSAARSELLQLKARYELQPAMRAAQAAGGMPWLKK